MPVCISTCDLSRRDLSRWAGARGKMVFSAEMPLSLSEIGNSYYTVWKMHGLAWLSTSISQTQRHQQNMPQTHGQPAEHIRMGTYVTYVATSFLNIAVVVCLCHNSLIASSIISDDLVGH